MGVFKYVAVNWPPVESSSEQGDADDSANASTRASVSTSAPSTSGLLISTSLVESFACSCAFVSTSESSPRAAAAEPKDAEVATLTEIASKSPTRPQTSVLCSMPVCEHARVISRDQLSEAATNCNRHLEAAGG